MYIYIYIYICIYVYMHVYIYIRNRSFPSYSAAHWNTLYHIVTHCNSLTKHAGKIVVRHNSKKSIFSILTYCNALQHTATHCNTLQHAATHYNLLQLTATQLQHAGKTVASAQQQEIDLLNIRFESMMQVFICVCKGRKKGYIYL